MAHWRESVNPEIKAHFERLVTKSAHHKEAYENARQSAIAQLWTANAIQEKELDELREKIALLEKAVQVLAGKGKLAEQAVMKANFVEKALTEITGKKPEEEKIDANKAMRDVISRVRVARKMDNEMQNAEKKEEAMPVPGSCICNEEDSNVLCRHPNLVKEKGYLYYISKEGNLARVPMSRGSEKEKGKQEILHQCNIKRENEWLYYVDKQMNAAKAKMERKEAKKESPA
ncbi:MAG: hypothetical protein QME12_03125, partial [Nanoarchaeota archaeon]|nr:hypothetical protein [Nanoarchaeota archaeon]